MTEDLPAVLEPAGVRATVADLLGESASDIGEDENLFDLGMDSIRLMTLVNIWADAGRQVDLGTLAEDPTLAAWTRLATGGRDLRDL